jgi:hypothetical protein
MKDNLFHSYYETLENQITEELTKSFLEFIGFEGGFGGYYYDF